MTVVTKEDMRAAKGLIQRSWVQGDEAVFASPPLGCCVATACQRIFRNGDKANTAVLLFKDANGIPKEMPIGEWNDAPERTKADVLAAFDKAIERSAEQNFYASVRKRMEPK